MTASMNGGGMDDDPGRLRLIIDGGKTKTDAIIVDAAGTRVAASTGPGLEIIGTPNGLELVIGSLRDTLGPLRAVGSVGAPDTVGSPSGFHTVCFGLNGVHAPSASTMLAVDALRAVTRASRYIVASDVVMTFVGALGVRAGVTVAAGTGSVILSIGEDGRAHRVDGDGPLFADRGSGYDIGRRGLDSALRVADGLPGSAALYDQLVERFGGVRDAVGAVYSSVNPIQAIASFSRNVAAAATAGDTAAIGIWRLAGKELAQSAVAAAVQAGLTSARFPVSWSGGLFAAGSLLLQPFEDELRRLAPNAQLQHAQGGALAGGTTLALRTEPVLTEVSTWIDEPA
jgi:glucosamine kinase